MDWSAIGTWAGDHGPWVGIIFAQWAIIWRLLNRFFAQQDIVVRALQASEKSTEIVQKIVEDQ